MAWLPIPGYEGFEASEDGQIRKDGVIVPQYRMSHGYMRVGVGPGKRQTVHVLVALAFLGERPAKHDICHKNGDRSDNHASNLRYGTRAENIADTMAHGRVPRGSRHHGAKLTEQQVREIKSRIVAGERQASIARSFGIGQDEVSRIKTGKRWAHIEGVAA